MQEDTIVTTAEVNLDVENEEVTKVTAAEVSLDVAGKDIEKASPAGERKQYKCCMLVTLAIVLVTLAMAGLTVYFFVDHSSGYDQQTATLSGTPAHAGAATEVLIVDDSAADNAGQKAMTAAVAGDAPYFRKWFGNPDSKAFHHDGGASDVMVAAKYAPTLLTGGCYEIHEWHPSGPWHEMSLSASVEVKHAHGTARMLLDQSSHGGQWNFLASFDFKKDAAQVVLSNNQSRCVGAKPCYTSFDAFRFVYTAPKCDPQQKTAKSLKENTFVFGNLLLSVSNVPSFIEDVKVTQALKSALATMAGVQSQDVSIFFTASERRLTSSPQLSASLIVSYRISTSSGRQPSTLVDKLDAKTTAEVDLTISQALLSAGSVHQTQVVELKATLDTEELTPDTAGAGTVQKVDTKVTLGTGDGVSAPSGPAPDTKPSCMPATIINDFDSHLVTSIVSPAAQGEAFRPGRVGEKPYFHDWFGDILKKDFHHDATMNKGLLQVNYTTPLSEAGCYMLEEWHLGGNQYCLSYMPQRVPFHVHGVDGVQTAYADQSTNGGQWNSLGLFQLSTSATVVMSNAGTNDCEYRGMCYTVFDSIRLVRVGSHCNGVDDSKDSVSRMSDLACDSSNNLAQVRYAVGLSQDSTQTAGASPVQLLEITSPDETTVVRADQKLKISWQTEGVASGTDVRISLFYNDQNLASTNYRMGGITGEAYLRMPGAHFIQQYSSAAAGGNSFRIRVDVQHAVVELSNGWSDQLYAYSPYFTVKM